jgi:hypothetical protein
MNTNVAIHHDKLEYAMATVLYMKPFVLDVPVLAT